MEKAKYRYLVEIWKLRKKKSRGEEKRGGGIISLMSSSGVEKLYRINGERSGEGLEMWT